MTFSMSRTWKMSFGLIAAFGGFVAGYGIAGTAGWVDAEEPPMVLGFLIVAGGAIVAFGLSALRHAKIRVTETELEFLGLGVVCRPRRIELSRVTRLGVGREKSSGGGDERILLIDRPDERRIAIKVEMYADVDGIIAALSAATGLPPSPTRRTWRGADFDDDEPDRDV